MSQPFSVGEINLDNCALEPIHIPGLVQSHGALFSFARDGRLTHMSTNAHEVLGIAPPELGVSLAGELFAANAGAWEAIQEAIDSEDFDEQGLAHEVTMNGRVFDLVTHRYAGRAIAEFEPRPTGAEALGSFAVRARRAMARLRNQSSVEQLLAVAVVAVRQLTGFDRVMAYRFRHDDSGEIAAESKIDSLESFLGRRYPAGDIPAQARRLYLLNTLRLIVDVNAPPAALSAASAQVGALDMSHCVLRSVSPIHLEYLRNIGVASSMSVSIIVQGRLWGMIACHHGEPRQVAYVVRMACDVLAQLLASNVQSLLARQLALDTDRASALRSLLVETVLHAEDAGAALASLAPSLMTAFSTHAVVVAEDNRVLVEGTVAPEISAHIVGWLAAQPAPLHGLISVDSSLEMPRGLGAESEWCGMLAFQYDELSNGWVVFLRKEQIETIQWGDEPRKVYPVGPLGDRLTPQGSMAVWLQTVSGRSVPWSRFELDLARQFADELARVSASRMAVVSRARSELLAILGHDLRDPLQSITMAAHNLQRDTRDSNADGARFVQHIRFSTGRMARLIGQVLDASRLQIGIGLQMQLKPVELSALLAELLNESRLAYPDAQILQELESPLVAFVDADRIAQLCGNLVSNARQHGTANEPTVVQLSRQGAEVFIEVSNMAPPIDADFLPHLFAAFHRARAPSLRNKSGLGLGLHIAQAIARGHRGHIAYRYAEPYVVFTARFPLQADPVGG